MKLAKIGYYGGDPEAIMKAPYKTVLNILAYERFDQEFMESAIVLNKPEK